ncbi:shikimate kinase [Zobellia alginiliquefaciens]|uniref:shikimate kinase n=1 Tax=Zobellia alginiliquefaciens TaxID=3032586 RepID=UPI0023E3D55D|nr:shikimate kinase [Zobellia alginiliquefaciens]
MYKKENFVIVLVGVCGTGKSIVGDKVARKLDIPFFDADALFNEQLASDKKNRTDDSSTWLSAITNLIQEEFTKKGCVVSCSILKKEQRLQLAENLDLNIDWVFMRGTYEKVNERLEKEHEPHQTLSSLQSDFESLEIPKRALTVDITNTDQEIVDTILKYLARKYG